MDSYVFTHDGWEYTVRRTDADLGAICSPGPDTFSHVGALNAEILRLAEEIERLRALAKEVWESVPDDPMVVRHAAALNALGAFLKEEEVPRG